MKLAILQTGDAVFASIPTNHLDDLTAKQVFIDLALSAGVLSGVVATWTNQQIGQFALKWMATQVQGTVHNYREAEARRQANVTVLDFTA